MGKKGNRGKGQQKKEKTVISLFEFNQNATVGQNVPVGQDVAALPSAPKAAEDWDAEGGRPEYNSRGYKERRVDAYADGGGADDDFENRDWTRRGAIDGGDEGGSGFGTGPERDWGNSRQGPLDALDGPRAERDWGGARSGPGPVAAGFPERNSDWGATRRGPVDAEFSTPTGERDWGQRKGPVDAVLPTAAETPDNWADARKGPIDAIQPTAASSAENWAGARKGPVDAVQPTAASSAENWAGARKGPVDAVQPTAASSAENWADARRVQVQPTQVPAAPRDVNFSEMRRGSRVLPDAPAPAAGRDVNFAEMRRGSKVVPDAPVLSPVRDVNFSEMRRGAKARPDVAAPAAPQEAQDAPRAGVATASSWRRSKPVSTQTRSAPARAPTTAGTERVTADMARMNVQKSNDTPVAPPARDWGAARRGQPLPSARRAPRNGPGGGMAAARKAPVPAEGDAVSRIEITTDPSSEWTTVRTVEKRKAPIRRGGPRTAAPSRRDADKLNATPVVAAKAEDAASSVA